MAISKKTELTIERRYDPRQGRHAINGEVHVLHCHHYLTLYTQLAEDCGMLDGRKLLVETAEDSFRPVLADCWRRQGAELAADRIALAEQYYALAGLGKLRVVAAGPDLGRAELDHSHLDAGWIKKWGSREQPVNHVTRGYLAALYAALNGTPPRSWRVSEVRSLVAGAGSSLFVAVRA